MINVNIEDLTIAQARQLSALFNPQPQAESPYKIGGKYFIRTVTHHHTGRLVRVTQQELVLEDAAWIADDGQLTQALATGTFSEVEIFPKGPVIIGRGSVIDAVEINSIPESQK